MELVKKSIGKWITAAVILVIGILCIVAGAAAGDQSGADAYKGISLTLGITFIIIAALAIVLGLVGSILTKNETAFLTAGVGAAVTLAAGIFFVNNEYTAGNLIDLFIYFVPYVLIVVGAVIAVDATLTLVFAIVKKNFSKVLVAVIIEYIIAAVSIVLGCLAIGNDPVIKHNVQLVIFGVIVIVYALFMVLETFVSVPTVVVIAKKDNDKVVDAEVKNADADATSTEEKAE